MLAPWKKSYDQPRQNIEKQKHHLLTKFHLVKVCFLPVVRYGCESWAIKKAEHWIFDAFELWCWRTFLSIPWTVKISNHSILKKIRSWIFIERNDSEAEAPIIWPPDMKSWLIGKDPSAGKDWRQEEKGMAEDEMVIWPHWLDVQELEQTPGVADGQGSLACCCPWFRKESDMTEWLNRTDVIDQMDLQCDGFPFPFSW